MYKGIMYRSRRKRMQKEVESEVSEDNWEGEKE
jgi:hypothetical protein